MGKKLSALQALDIIKSVPLYHLEYSSDCDECGVSTPIEAYDGTIEENHPGEIKVLRDSINKLNEITNIESELGTDALIGLKALQNGIYYADGSFSDDERLYLSGNEIYNHARKKWVRFDRYGLDWALTKEELIK